MDKAVVFIFGLIIGSFLNVCIYRLPKNESIVLPGSYCPKCRKHIRWFDNIPLVSYTLLAGKCRYCKARISFRYPLVEFLTAALLTVLFAGFGPTPKFFAYSVLVSGLVVATFVDFEIQEIPDQVSIGGIIAGLIFAAVFPQVFDAASRIASIVNSLLGIAAGAGSIYLMKVLGTLAFKDKVKKLGLDSAMGDGDITLMAMIGAFLGWKLTIFTFFAAPFFGAVTGLILKIKYGRDIMPYGPYLSLAAVLAVFYGEKIIRNFFCMF